MNDDDVMKMNVSQTDVNNCLLTNTSANLRRCPTLKKLYLKPHE